MFQLDTCSHQKSSSDYSSISSILISMFHKLNITHHQELGIIGILEIVKQKIGEQINYLSAFEVWRKKMQVLTMSCFLSFSCCFLVLFRIFFSILYGETSIVLVLKSLMEIKRESYVKRKTRQARMKTNYKYTYLHEILNRKTNHNRRESPFFVSNVSIYDWVVVISTI